MKLIEGDTDPIEFDLKRAPTPGATPVTFNANGLTPSATIKAKDRTTTVTTTGGKVEWADQANSRVRFKRASTDFLQSKSPYYLHFHVTDASGEVASWPDGDGFELVVRARGEG